MARPKGVRNGEGKGNSNRVVICMRDDAQSAYARLQLYALPRGIKFGDMVALAFDEFLAARDPDANKPKTPRTPEQIARTNARIEADMKKRMGERA